MPLIDSLKIYGIALTIFLVIDGLWLTLIAKQFYGKHLGYLLRPDPNLLAAGLFYLLFIIGIFIFAIVPGLKQDSVTHAVLLGALFGLITYATYDLTNLATIKNWPMIVVVIDMLWGTVLSATVAGLTAAITQKVL